MTGCMGIHKHVTTMMTKTTILIKIILIMYTLNNFINLAKLQRYSHYPIRISLKFL